MRNIFGLSSRRRSPSAARRKLAMVSFIVCLGALGVLSSTAWSLDLIDPEVFRPNPVEELKLDLGPSELSDRGLHVEPDSLTIEDERILRAAHDQEDREDADWCWWSALAKTGEDLAKGETVYVDEVLEGALIGCLEGHLADSPEFESLRWVAKAITVRDNLNLLQSLGESGEEAWSALASGIRLPPSVWEKWLAEDAAAIPPVQ
jgi:hypothetical protein